MASQTTEAEGRRGPPGYQQPRNEQARAHLVEPEIARAIAKAIHDALASGKIESLAVGRMGMGAREVGYLIAQPNPLDRKNLH